MKISIIGAGYVGLVTGACLSSLGNQVICMDVDTEKIELLKKGRIPIYEPGLEELVRQNQKEGRLVFTDNIQQAVEESLVIFIAVGTPPREDGTADLTYIEKVSQEIARFLPNYRLIVEKSTVPVETGYWIEHTIRINNQGNQPFDVASNPEFLREGKAIEDFLHPDRIVIGVGSQKAEEILLNLYKPLCAQIIVTDIKSAELIKHASNAFLSTKISFINAISRICEKVGADVLKVAEGVGLDRRIGKDFLNAGIGFGGFCLPKDIDAFIRLCEKSGYNFELLKVVSKINTQQREHFVNKIENSLWIIKDKTIAIAGLSFKPQTDDMRFAPAVEIIQRLLQDGAHIRVYDPRAIPKAKAIFKRRLTYCSNIYSLVKDSDCLVILTDWDEFKQIDFLRIKQLLKHPLIIDGRNIYDPVELKSKGFRYIGIGRS